MKLVDQSVSAYLELLASDAPAPGGGSSAALTGAQGASLCAMVAALTIGRERYAAFDARCRDALQKANVLKDALLIQVDADASAYFAVSNARKLPDQTEEARAARLAAIERATLLATETPQETMRLCLDALELTQSLVSASNPNVQSDLSVAALTLFAACAGAWENVRVNLPYVRDAKAAETFRANGEKLLSRAKIVSDAILAALA